MTTTRIHRTAILMTLVFVAFALIGCSGDAGSDLMKAYASANSDGTALASHASVQFSPRNTCKMNDGIILLAQLDSNLKAWDVTELTISTDDWLDQQMAQFSCILPREAK